MAVREEFRGDYGLEAPRLAAATWDRACSSGQPPRSVRNPAIGRSGMWKMIWSLLFNPWSGKNGRDLPCVPRLTRAGDEDHDAARLSRSSAFFPLRIAGGL